MSHRLVLLLAAFACVVLPTIVHAEEPLQLTVCELLAKPGDFNHKLIEISGTVSRGFEDFTLSDSTCHNKNMIWLELGGKQGSQVIYCCGVSADPKRSSSLVVEGIETSIVEDDLFTKFQKLTLPRKGYGLAQVTLVGRYFSGEERKLPGGTYWIGYGHMGMATLLVVQQVKQVARK